MNTQNQTITNGGTQSITQIVYLDFDGELTKYRNPALNLDIDVAVEDSFLSPERIRQITDSLNEQYAGQNVRFVSDKSDLSGVSEYSTIYVGKTSSFTNYGTFAGLAEAIDSGNQNQSDNAFVLLDSSSDNARIIATISHELDHLLGTLDHGGDGLERYAARKRYDVSSGVTSTGITLNNDSMYVSGGGTASDTTVNRYGFLYVSNGGVAKNTTVNKLGNLFVSNGGVASDTTVSSDGRISVSSGGIIRGSCSLAGQLSASGTVDARTAVINFAVDQKSMRKADYTYCINNISLIYGASYTITVDADEQQFGTYRLAQGASAFTQNIGLENTDGTLLGTFISEDSAIDISVKTIVACDRMYTLNNDDTGNLTLKVSKPDPVNIYQGDFLIKHGSSFTSEYLGPEGNDTMYVGNGGVVNSTRVNNKGYLHVSNGGKANNTTVNAGGYLHVSNGGTTNKTDVCDGDLYVSNGGVANSTTLFALGHLSVSSGGVANDTIIKHIATLNVSHGGVANRTTVNDGRLYVENGGVANSTTVSINGHVYVLSGGVANSTTLSNYGILCVSSGGSALDVVNSGGIISAVITGGDTETVLKGVNANGENFYISNGLASNISGNLAILSGGVANSTTVNGDEGYLLVSNGGTANETTVNSGGRLHVENGGVANSTTVSRGGDLYVYNGGVANSTTVKQNSELYVSNGGTANNTMVNEVGELHVSNGGVANSTTVNSRGILYVSNGGMANSTTVNRGGDLYVYNGGSALNVVNFGCIGCVVTGGDTETVLKGVNADGKSFYISNGVASNISGRLDIRSGGVANSTTVISGCRLYVSSGGSALDVVNSGCVGGDVTGGDTTTVLKGVNADGESFYISNGVASNISGSLHIYSGGVANRTTVKYGDVHYVFSGGIANNTVVSSGGYARADSGIMNAAVIGSGGSMYICHGAVASSTVVYSGGYALIGSGSIASDTVVVDSGELHVSNGGVANNTITNDSGELHVSNGGVANNTTINAGNLYVSNGGVVNTATVNLNGKLHVSDGGVANGTGIVFCGEVHVSNGGVVNNTTINDGELYVSNGGTANSTTVNPDGELHVSNGGVANSTTVKLDGKLHVSNGGTANSTTVGCGGRMTISSGGLVAGTLNLIDGAIVSAYEGAKIDFTVSEQTDAAAALITNWNLISGSSNASCTVTVNAGQKEGTYVLADNAAGFDKTLTVKTVDGTTLGTISVGETNILDGKDYTLANDAGELTLTIGSEFIKQTVSDYNKSGKSDMIQFVNGKIYVTHDTGTGYVQTGPVNDITGWNVTEIRRDLTGDGFADIQITADAGNGTTWVATLRNDYSETGCITLNYQFVGAYNNELWSYLGPADFNGDGKSEILMVQTEAGKDLYGHRNVVGWVTDATTCEWIDNIWLGSLNDGWDIAGTADVTGDGKDNVILRSADGMIGYWNEFGGMPEDIVELKNAGNRVLITTGDFDGDGAEDFLWESLSDNNTMSLWSDMSGAFTDVTIGKISDLGCSWTFAGAGDYNGDGTDEILWCDTTTYRTAYSEGNKENFTKLTVIA